MNQRVIMNQVTFLATHVFNNLKNHNAGFEDLALYYSSEIDFASVLERVAHYGIGVYEIMTFLNGKPFETVTHEAFKKKITDAKWYKRAYLDLKNKQPGLLYCARFKVSSKLLAR